MENNEEVLFKNTKRYKKFKSEFYGLNKKIKSRSQNGFLFSDIVKLTRKIDSNVLNINICLYL